MELTPDVLAADPGFWARIDSAGPVLALAPELGPCWLWQGAISLHGKKRDTPRGRLTRSGKNWFAHRYAWTLAVGPIPAGVLLDHKCFTTICVRPSHLRHSSHSENGQNRSGAPANNHSGYRGVYWHKASGKWMAYGKAPGVKLKYLGIYVDPLEAAVAAWEYRREHHTRNDLDPYPARIVTGAPAA